MLRDDSVKNLADGDTLRDIRRLAIWPRPTILTGHKHKLIFSFDLHVHCLLGLLSHAGLVSLSRFIGTGLMIVFGALCIRGMIYRDIVLAVNHDN